MKDDSDFYPFAVFISACIGVFLASTDLNVWLARWTTLSTRISQVGQSLLAMFVVFMRFLMLGLLLTVTIAVLGFCLLKLTHQARVWWILHYDSSIPGLRLRYQDLLDEVARSRPLDRSGAIKELKQPDLKNYEDLDAAYVAATRKIWREEKKVVLRNIFINGPEVYDDSTYS